MDRRPGRRNEGYLLHTLSVHYNGTTRAVRANGGESILSALQRAGISAPDAPCGGNGTCKKCLVHVEGLGEVLACKTAVTGDLSVTIPRQNAGAVVAREGAKVDVELTPRPGLGVAVDIGTTTVVAHLYDLTDGSHLGTRSGMNCQRPFGADVISRIQYTVDRADGLEQLKCAIQGQISGYISDLCADADRAVTEVTHVTVAANTVMEHIFTGLSPATIAVAPFTPLSLFGDEYDGESVGLHKGCTVYLAPAEAGYVGGDITAGMLACGASKAEKPVLFLDIGTNGEMALGSAKDGFVCCATAAGPAFEGAVISQGMAACDGAISAVAWDGTALNLTVLGGGQAVGICGSGLVDALSVMLELGAVDETGRLLPPDEAEEAALPYLTEDEDENVCFRLTDSVAVTAADVRQLQLAKAAIAAGIQTLLEDAGLEEDDVDKLYLAGGFGNYIRKESAAAIGLLPASMLGRIVSVGNTAGQGAAAVLLSARARTELDALPANCRYLELSGHKQFNDFYIECMMFE